MRARRREINIFNMSLLDILCGALGAFCFMMLVALPYYKPSAGSAAQARENQQKTEQLMRDIEKMKGQLGDVSATADLEDLLRRLEPQIKSLEGQVNQLTAENQQLTATNDKQKRLLAQKKPFLIVSTATDPSQDVDLYLADDMIPEGGNKSANSPFDPAKPRNHSNWRNDITAYVPGRGVTAWLSSDLPIDAHFRMYVKLASQPNERRSAIVKSTAFGEFGATNFAALPEVTLTPERFWNLVGIFTVDGDNKASFKEATAAERDGEWKAIAKTAPPPVSVATPTAAPSNLSPDLLERIRKAREQRQGQQQAAPSASPSP